MRFALQILANENVPEPVVAELRRRGHDVAWIAEIMRGAGDHEVLALAQRQSRLVVTYDKDFGELTFSAHLPARCGVVLLRLSGSSPAVDNARAVEALGSCTNGQVTSRSSKMTGFAAARCR